MVPEVTEWLALHRAHEGGVTKLGSNYLNQGRPVAGYLADVIDELINTGLLALGQSTPIVQQAVCFTHTGQVRYVELCKRSTPADAGVVHDGD